MRKSKTSRANTEIRGKKLSWQRRPSEIRGYQTAMYLTSDDGEYVRVDYALKDNKVRIYLEDSEEGGNPYYLVIINGKITTQRNSTTGRPADVVQKLKKRAGVLRTISNKDVLRAVKGALSLGEPAHAAEKDDSRAERLEVTRKRYFRDEDTGGEAGMEAASRPVQRLFIHALDIAAGGIISGGLFFYFHSYIIAGLTAAVFGILIGMVDLLIRGVNPSFIKMLIFILSGLALYIYGYYVF
jgi:hypothetical protein